MKLSYGEFRFLVFFIPIFSLKLLNITAGSKTLVLISAVSLLIFLIQLFFEKFSRNFFYCFAGLAVFSALLIFTCGKQGAFFSVVMIIALKDIDLNKHVYKYCFAVGIVVTAIFMYLEREGHKTVRYMGGSWQEMIKRSNILYISFMALICLYLFQKNNKIKWLELILIALSGYTMYLYIGSRTGLLSMVILLIVLILMKLRIARNSNLFKWGCIFSPLLCMLFSIITNYLYGKAEILNLLNSYMQGRLALGKAYFNVHNLKLFGQKIFESTDASNFWNLDCAYLDMLICYGIIFSLIWIISSIIVIKWLYENKRYVDVAVIVMYAVYGISETFLPNCFLNVSLFLYGECLYTHFNKSLCCKD